MSTPQGGPGLFLTLGGGGTLEAPLSERWKALLKVSSPSVVDMTFFGEKIFTIRGPLGGPPDIRASAALQSIPDQTNRSFVLPSDSDTHLEVGTIELVATVSADEIDLDATEAEITLAFHECAVVIATKDNDGFLSSILPDEGLRLPFNFGLGASRKRGLFTEGNVPFLSGRSTRALRLARDTASQDGKPVPIAGAIGKGFNASIPIGVALGAVELHSLQLKLTPNDTSPNTSDIVAEASASLGGKPDRGAGADRGRCARRRAGADFFKRRTIRVLFMRRRSRRQPRSRCCATGISRIRPRKCATCSPSTFLPSASGWPTICSTASGKASRSAPCSAIASSVACTS